MSQLPFPSQTLDDSSDSDEDSCERICRWKCCKDIWISFSSYHIKIPNLPIVNFHGDIDSDSDDEDENLDTIKNKIMPQQEVISSVEENNKMRIDSIPAVMKENVPGENINVQDDSNLVQKILAEQNYQQGSLSQIIEDNDREFERWKRVLS